MMIHPPRKVPLQKIFSLITGLNAGCTALYLAGSDNLSPGAEFLSKLKIAVWGWVDYIILVLIQI
jgi:hypothetical protein